MVVFVKDKIIDKYQKKIDQKGQIGCSACYDNDGLYHAISKCRFPVHSALKLCFKFPKTEVSLKS